MAYLQTLLFFIICLLPSIWAVGLTCFLSHMNWLSMEEGHNGVATLWFVCIAVLAVAQLLFVMAFENFLSKDQTKG
jgi:apolipoprotein N-acyltransferase